MEKGLCKDQENRPLIGKPNFDKKFLVFSAFSPGYMFKKVNCNLITK